MRQTLIHQREGSRLTSSNVSNGLFAISSSLNGPELSQPFTRFSRLFGLDSFEPPVRGRVESQQDHCYAAATNEAAEAAKENGKVRRLFIYFRIGRK